MRSSGLFAIHNDGESKSRSEPVLQQKKERRGGRLWSVVKGLWPPTATGGPFAETSGTATPRLAVLIFRLSFLQTTRIAATKQTGHHRYRYYATFFQILNQTNMPLIHMERCTITAASSTIYSHRILKLLQCLDNSSFSFEQKLWSLPKRGR